MKGYTWAEALDWTKYVKYAEWGGANGIGNQPDGRDIGQRNG